jgi:hypothetical protein
MPDAEAVQIGELLRTGNEVYPRQIAEIIKWRSTANWCLSTAISTASASGVGPASQHPNTRRPIIDATNRNDLDPRS